MLNMVPVDVSIIFPECAVAFLKHRGLCRQIACAMLQYEVQFAKSPAFNDGNKEPKWSLS
jgi:hypothetical protein